MNKIISKPFNLTISNEDGYPRLYITHPDFKGRIKKRIGRNTPIEDPSFIYQLKFEFNKHFSDNEITKQAVQSFINQYVSINLKGNASIFDFFDEFIEIKKITHNVKTENLLKQSTINSYKHSKVRFEEFLIKKNILPYPDRINKKLLDDFYYSLTVSENTRVKTHRRIKAFITYLYKTKRIDMDESYDQSIFAEKYDNQDPNENDIALTESEVKRLIELREQFKASNFIFPAEKYKKNMVNLQKKQFNLKNENLIKSLDCFLFMIATGQYYSDIIKSKVKINKNRKHTHLSYKRAKNNSLCKAIPFTNDGVFMAQEIMEQYHIRSGTNFPIKLSLTHFSIHLERIGKMAGFDFKLTNKMARKTFASIVYFEKNMPINILRYLLGHKNVKHTEHYLRIEDDDLADEVAKIMSNNQ